METILGYLMSFVAVILIILSSILILLLVFRMKKGVKRVCIVVLGDIGRSPRMQYHANSFAKESFNVEVVAFRGSLPISSLRNGETVSFTYLSQPPKKPIWLPGSLYYVLKASYLGLQLFLVLFFLVEKPSYFLVQNPPSIPTLSIVWLISCVKGSWFIIDWHNYAYTILSINLKRKDHFIVKLSKWYEGVFGYLSNKNICVTKAMQNDLLLRWKVKSVVLYDRAPDCFQEASVVEKHELFLKMVNEGYRIFANSIENSTAFTRQVEYEIALRKNRPALIISSTSWTEDEDFSILLNALEKYDEQKKVQHTLPNLICVITGKGPQKSYYQGILKEKRFSNVEVITPWLSPENYPKLIGCGDLGICLHTSSSGLDLPMKVVDMFGCGLPVCAVNFSCLDELVKHNHNGLIFKNSSELFSQLIYLLDGFPNGCEKLSLFRSNLSSFQERRWHENWLEVVLPLVS